MTATEESNDFLGRLKKYIELIDEEIKRHKLARESMGAIPPHLRPNALVYNELATGNYPNVSIAALIHCKLLLMSLFPGLNLNVENIDPKVTITITKVL